MKASIRSKLDQITERFEEITALLADPGVQGNQNQFRSLSREYAQLEPVVECYGQYRELEDDISRFFLRDKSFFSSRCLLNRLMGFFISK